MKDFGRKPAKAVGYDTGTQPRTMRPGFSFCEIAVSQKSQPIHDH